MSCVITILDSEDWLEITDEELELVNGDRSKPLIVGELSVCCGRGGEKVWFLKLPPPPLLPPPP